MKGITSPQIKKNKYDFNSNYGDSGNVKETQMLLQKTRRQKSQIPWVDKYRPLKLDDIVDQNDTIKLLKNIVSSGNMPHLLFYGPPGTGKCLDPFTQVMLYSGDIKLAKDITINDVLMGDDGTLREVYSTITGNDIMYKVVQQYGDNYIVNSEHIISLKLILPYIINTNFDKIGYDITYFENFELKTIFVNDISNFNFDNVNINQRYDICDIKITDYIYKPDLWKMCFKGFKSSIIDPESWTEIYDNAFFEGFNLNYTYDISMASKYKTASYGSRENFINGILEKNGDNKLHIENKGLFDDIVFIIRSLGLSTKLSKICMYYECEILPVSHEDNAYDITIEKLHFGQYCGFEISGNKRFLLGDFTVTHNTSSILAIANELFGPNKIEERVIELNASDERGINIVRVKIMTLAKMSVSEKDPNYTCPPYKIIILDEADAMTVEAQSALRKIMEDNSSITRFCFVCNYINQIIGPIISRCAKFRFKPIELNHMNKKLIYISTKENINITESAIETINYVSNGDMRKAITLLQNLKYLDKNIDDNDVCKMACIMPTDILNSAINICMEFGDSANKITNLTNDIIMKGFPLNNILDQLINTVAENEILTDKMKSLICLHIANTEQRLINGADEFMQLLSIFMCIKNISNGLKSIYDL
jgi:replication factor C subunit 2/4